MSFIFFLEVFISFLNIDATLPSSPIVSKDIFGLIFPNNFLEKIFFFLYFLWV